MELNEAKRLTDELKRKINLSKLVIFYELIHIVELMGFFKIPYGLRVLVTIPYVILIISAIHLQLYRNPKVAKQFKILLGLLGIKVGLFTILGTVPFYWNFMDRSIVVITLLMVIANFWSLIAYIDYVQNTEENY